jgi:hypothetical protein
MTSLGLINYPLDAAYAAQLVRLQASTFWTPHTSGFEDESMSKRYLSESFHDVCLMTHPISPGISSYVAFRRLTLAIGRDGQCTSTQYASYRILGSSFALIFP